MTRPKLFLHVGLHKTGTTFIQRNLIVFQDELNSDGFFLPGRLGRIQPGHHEIAHLLRREGPEAFVDVVNDQRNLERIILSAETFSAVIKDRNFWGPGVYGPLNRAFDVTPIIFLRRQDFMLESVFAQLTKFDRVGSHLKIPRYEYDYTRVVDLLSTSFGEESVKVVIYRDDEKTDPWLEFCNAVGLNVDRYSSNTRAENSSAHRRKTLALSQLKLPDRASGRFLYAAMQMSNAIHNDEKKFLTPVEDRSHILRENIAGNNLICDRFAAPAEARKFFTSSQVDESWVAPEPISDFEWKAFIQDLAVMASKSAR